MRIPEQTSNAVPGKSAGIAWICDFERCENIDDLRRVMETINRNQYQLISVTQDEWNVYTVFFRRCLVG